MRLIRSVRGVWHNCHVFGGQKLLNSQSGVHGGIVMMEHPVVCAPSVWMFLRHVLTKLLQEVTAAPRVDSLTWRDEFLMENPITFEKADQH
jgi:hypothetical protein